MNVLLLTHRLPYAPNRGDRVRAYHIVRTLAARVRLHVVSLGHDEAEIGEADRLRALGVDVTVLRTDRIRGYLRAGLSLPGPRPLTHALLDAAGMKAALGRAVESAPPAVVLAYCSGMARFALEAPLAAYPLVLDMVDVDSEKWATLADAAAVPRKWIYRREARCLRRFEAVATQAAVTTLVVNARERVALSTLAPGADVRVMQNGVDLPALRSPRAPVDSPRVVFCGVMNYEPNVEGMLWFTGHVWPLVRAARPDATLTIVGASPSDSIRRLASSDNGIEVTGTVPDVREYLWSAAVSVAPLLTARGIQNKVLEALAAGVPCVVTEAVMAGLPPEAAPGCRVGAAPADIAGHVLDWLGQSAAERRAAAERASLTGLGWDAQLACLPGVLENAARSHSDLASSRIDSPGLRNFCQLRRGHLPTGPA